MRFLFPLRSFQLFLLLFMAINRASLHAFPMAFNTLFKWPSIHDEGGHDPSPFLSLPSPIKYSLHFLPPPFSRPCSSSSLTSLFFLYVLLPSCSGALRLPFAYATNKPSFHCQVVGTMCHAPNISVQAQPASASALVGFS